LHILDRLLCLIETWKMYNWIGFFSLFSYSVLFSLKNSRPSVSIHWWTKVSFSRAADPQNVLVKNHFCVLKICGVLRIRSSWECCLVHLNSYSMQAVPTSPFTISSKIFIFCKIRWVYQKLNQKKVGIIFFSGMKKFLGSMAKRTTDVAKSLAAEANKKKSGTGTTARTSIRVFLVLT